MKTQKILEVLSLYNRYWTTGTIESGIKRDLLSDCISQLDGKEVIVLKGIRRCGKSTLLAQVISHLLAHNTEKIMRSILL